YFLLAFAGIALFVGAFVIFNTLSITVAQRTREFATLRTLGASRRQVLWSVVLEAFVIGFLASVIGLFAGLGLAVGLNTLLKSFGGDLPTTGTVFATRTIVVSLVIGTVITLLAGVFPAIRATRVPPISAVREGAALPPSRFARFSPYIGGLVIALAIVLLAYAMFVDDLGTFQRLLSIAVGVLLLFVGVAMLSSRTVRPLAVGTNPVAKWALVAASALFYPITLALWLVRYGLYGSDRPAGKRAQALGAGALILAAIVALIALAISVTLALVIGFVVVLTFLVLWALRAAGRFHPEWPVEFPNVRPEGSASGLAKENSRRNPGRTASTAAALMIGLALVTFIAVLANGMKASNRGAIEDQVHSDYLLTAEDGFTPFVAGAGDALEGARGTEVVTPVRSDLAKVDGEDGYLTGIEPETIAAAYTFEWKSGSGEVLRSLGRDGAVVAKDFADEHDLKVGSPMTLLVPSGKRLRLFVKGIYEPPPFFPILGAVSIPKATFDGLYERPRNQYVFVNVPGEPSDADTRMLERLVADFPDAKVQTREQWIDQQDEDFNDFLMFLYALLALAVIVSLFGMVNTLVLSIYERTRELGMLRAVGMTRRQVRRMIRQESVVTALIGAVLAIPLGILLAALVTRALSQFDIEFAIPWAQLAVFAVIAVVVGIFAAIAPARRAARLNV
ncbi:MAG: ABC transporter permease, partial [Actinomycetota bacterium]|nr:ABC transporter permease [Actinomycetota bacterium]